MHNGTQFLMEIDFFSLSGLTSKLPKFLRFDWCLSEVYLRAPIGFEPKEKRKKKIFSNKPKG